MAAPVGEFEWLVNLPHGNPGEQFERGGAGDREAAMGAIDPAVSVVKGRDAHFVHAERFDARTGQDDVGDGIERADLVEADFFGRFAVDFPFGDGNAVEDRKRVGFDEVAQIAGFQEGADLRIRAPVRVLFLVMMFVTVVMIAMLMGVMMLVAVIVSGTGARFILFVVMGRAFVDAKFDPFDGFALLALEVHVEIAQVELGEFPLEGGRLDAQIAQCTNGHVAADARDTV